VPGSGKSKSSFYAAKLNLARINLKQTPLPVAQLQEAHRKTEQLLSDAIRETRNVSHELIPLLLKEQGLA
jgi:signal transduction histidine kinase